MQNVYYKGVAAARMEKNGKQLYNSNIESEYTGKEGHIVADINGKHFEKKFKDGLFPLPIDISPYSSIEMLKEKYGLLVCDEFNKFCNNFLASNYCFISIREEGSWEYNNRPLMKLAHAAGCDSNIIITNDMSVRDLLDPSYPYLLKDHKYETVIEMVEFVKKTFNPGDFSFDEKLLHLKIRCDHVYTTLQELESSNEDVYLLIRRDSTRKSIPNYPGLRVLATYKSRVSGGVKKVDRTLLSGII